MKILSKKIKLLTIAAVLSFAITSHSVAIQIDVDTSSQVLSFSGSFEGDFLSAQSDGGGIGNSLVDMLDLDGAVFFDNGVTTSAMFFYDTNFDFEVDLLLLDFDGSHTGANVQGTEIEFSYAGLSTSSQSYLESIIGSSLLGTHEVPIVSASVSSTGSSMLMFSFGFACVVSARRVWMGVV